MDSFSILPNEIFFCVDKNKSSILKNINKNKNINYDKVLLILDFLYMSSNRNNIISFQLEYLVNSCFYTPRYGSGNSISIFKSLLLELNNLGVIRIIDISDNKKVKEKITDLQLNKTYECELLYSIESNYFQLYQSEKNKIMGNKKQGLDNKKVLLLFCYFKSRIHTRPKDFPIGLHGENEVCHPGYDRIKEDIGLSTSTIKTYIEILKKLNLIRYQSAGDYYIKSSANKQIKSSNNYYTLYRDGWELELESAIAYYKKNSIDKVFVKSSDEEKRYNNKVENGRLSRYKCLANKPDAKQEHIDEYNRLLLLSEKLSDTDIIMFEVKSLLENKEYSGMVLSDIYDYIGRYSLGQKYRDIEDSLKILDKNDNLLINMDYYKWLMMNYSRAEHDKYFYAVQKKIRDCNKNLGA